MDKQKRISGAVDDGPVSEERRRFFELCGRYGFTAAVVAAAGGVLLSPQASAQTAQEERERRDAAQVTMTLATEYRIGATRWYPLMQLNLKENIQNATNGYVYVRLAPAGQLGMGSALAQGVQSNTIQAAQHSIANFSPFAPEVDLINIPYWCGQNQEFVNLVTSDAWKSVVHPKAEERGFKVLLYLVLDPRTVAARRGLQRAPLKTPEDLRGIKFRVPASEILQQFYTLAGANPTPVAWGETPSAIQQGVADALDPAVVALYSNGFKDILSWITFNKPVPDSQVYSCNLSWFRGLPSEVQEQIDFASEITFQQNLAQVPASRAYAMAEMAEAGVQFYTPTDDELAQWVEACGAQRPEWNSIKEDLAGSLAAFDRMAEAAQERGRFYVHDV
ncbi:TRAP-type C4-dicarboxylate transport system substrate-binding protein [Natronocella acetinitrilica]|uniref:TRAP-type C4-dicarboxylate transport system substrate-binding protein n=1 Tax=Natronocella acetinitrilica TaxID=414046 RepID=A0AAE3KA21_9GAMM|nr:TRAP transporter substrate-binding protein [Natronocella acetinitrilica]MCP1673640.1 TRAP-type C4-dicarboxylate transport system substrate-binding protein [Natronocella acetinitrilica]